MYRRFHDRFGTAGVVIAVIALIAALGGTALAASGALSGKQKKEVEKIAKKYAGKPGAPGATGPQGNPGPAGATGKDGANGTNGTNGIDGKSVTVTQLSAPECNGQGGAKFTVGAEEAEACNGQTGFTETLPAGKSLKGQWSVTGPSKAALAVNSVSFGIPLEFAPAVVHYINPNGMEWAVNGTTHEAEEVTPQPGCTGNVTEPGAEEGNLCVFAAEEENAAHVFFGTQPLPTICNLEHGIGGCFPAQGSKLGFGIVAAAAAEEQVRADGSWAVTAE